jgi:hypothetical protein
MSSLQNESKKTGVRLVVRSKRKADVKLKIGIPVLTRPVAQNLPPVAAPDNDICDQEFPIQDFVPLNDLPCDTLILMRSLEQKQQCLYIPLLGGALIPTILESQLQEKLEGSLVAQELLDLASENRVRRLTTVDGELVAWMETRHFVRAVWDAYQNNGHASNQDSSKRMVAVQWFLSNLSKWTTKSLSKQTMSLNWTDKSISLDKAVDILVEIQVLLPRANGSLLLWLPHWGTVLASIAKAQTKVMATIKRALYKELSVRNVESQSHAGGLSGNFVLHTLKAQGKVELLKRPSGEFLRVPNKL